MSNEPITDPLEGDDIEAIRRAAKTLRRVVDNLSEMDPSRVVTGTFWIGDGRVHVQVTHSGADREWEAVIIRELAAAAVRSLDHMANLAEKKGAVIEAARGILDACTSDDKDWNDVAEAAGPLGEALERYDEADPQLKTEDAP